MHAPGPQSQGEAREDFSKVSQVVLGHTLFKNLLESCLSLTSVEATEAQGGKRRSPGAGGHERQPQD